MGQALYRKYRSRKLSELVGQEHITTALANALKQGKISHAYLFTGPRGTGKTSVARILAHEVNQLDYDETETHLDIIEIDAASNRRIDEIRDLREHVHNAPAAAKYKVYIIDEVHMLTREAFNALLKTLEEPPAHVIFILATTEAHKLPETIVSRTQRYTFRPIATEKVIDHLKYIAKQEKIAVDEAALALIAAHGEGSFRDSISLLDQVRHTADKIDLAAVQRNLGLAASEAIDELIIAVANGQVAGIITQLNQMRDHGSQAAQIARQLGDRLRQHLIDNNGPLPAQVIAEWLRRLVEVPAANDPERLLEITLLEVALAAKPVVAQAAPQPAVEPAVAEAAVEQSPPAAPAEARPTAAKVAETPAKPAKSKTAAKKTDTSPRSPAAPTALDADSWQTVLQAIKAQHNTLYSVARMALPKFDGDELILTFSFPFHQKRLNDARNRQVISDIINEVTGRTVTITCLVDVNARQVPAAAAQPADESAALQNISNIFGGGEVLE